MSNRLTELLYRHRLSSPLSWVALAVAAALLIWIATQLVWLLLQWNEPLPEALPQVATASRQNTPPPSLAKWHLFGNAAPLEDGRNLAADAPATQLQLTLLGVWAGKDPRRGRAIIADAAGVETSLSVGREVAPGVILDQVLKDRVVLSRGGSSEVLMLARERIAPAAASTGSTGAGSKPGYTANAGVLTPSGPMGVTLPEGAISAPHLPMQGIDMEAVRKQLGADPRDLAQSMTATPVMENGKFVGVRLFSSKYPGALAKLGLQGDDVVTSVNGVDVSDPARIASVVANLQNARSLNVAVRRDGKTQNLSVDLN
jgi:general secretion pathway protein C